MHGMTDREMERLFKCLTDIRTESLKPRQRKYRIYNLCDRATLILKKALKREKI